jgi:hypothetical protein
MHCHTFPLYFIPPCRQHENHFYHLRARMYFRRYHNPPTTLIWTHMKTAQRQQNVGTAISRSVVRSRPCLRLLGAYTELGTILLILAPQPSWLCVLVDFHLQTLRRPGLFITHLLISYTLLFMILSSLIVCVVRDPGNPSATSHIDGAKGDPDEMGLREALLADDSDESSPHKWCRKCWVSIFLTNSMFQVFDFDCPSQQAPKPERAHHCSICRRCVLKMGSQACQFSGSSRFTDFLQTITVLG